MIVITLTDCPVALRGDLTKWLLEISTGVFVGQVSARVRDNLWTRVTKLSKNGRATMVFSTNNEQRLDFKVHKSDWEPIDFDGIKLVLRPSPARIKKMSELRLGYSKASARQMAKRRLRRQAEEDTVAASDQTPDTYVIIDIETSGLSPKDSEIIEISALKIEKNRVLDSYSKLVVSKKPIDAKIEELTGITNQMLNQQGEGLKTVLDEFLAFVGSHILVGHNISFDLSFINAACAKCSKMPLGNQCVDTLTMAKKIVKGHKGYSLKALAEYYGIETENAHRGLVDCYTTKVLYDKLLDEHR